jgi:hypothetical protein
MTSNAVAKQGVRFANKDLKLSTKEGNLDGSVVGVDFPTDKQPRSIQPARFWRAAKRIDKYAYDPDYEPQS